VYPRKHAPDGRTAVVGAGVGAGIGEGVNGGVGEGVNGGVGEGVWFVGASVAAQTHAPLNRENGRVCARA
jgi:hypothetical protein